MCKPGKLRVPFFPAIGVRQSEMSLTGVGPGDAGRMLDIFLDGSS